MGQAKLKRRGIFAPTTTTRPGFVSVLIDNQMCAIRTGAETKLRTQGIAQETFQQMLGLHGDIARQDIAFITACELVQTVQLIAGCKDAAKKRRLEMEATCFAISLMHYENHPFLRVTHNSAEQTTELLKLGENELKAAA